MQRLSFHVHLYDAQLNRAQNTVHYHYWYSILVRHLLLPLPLSLPLFVLCCGTVVVATTHICAHGMYRNQTRAMTAYTHTHTHIYDGKYVNVCSLSVSYKRARRGLQGLRTYKYTVDVKKCCAYVYPFSVNRAHTVCIFQPYRFEWSRMSVLFFYSEVCYMAISTHTYMHTDILAFA